MEEKTPACCPENSRWGATSDRIQASAAVIATIRAGLKVHNIVVDLHESRIGDMGYFSSPRLGAAIVSCPAGLDSDSILNMFRGLGGTIDDERPS